MKYFLFIALSVASVSSLAQIGSICIYNPATEMTPLESTVTLQGSIVFNPMLVGDGKGINLATEEQKAFTLMLKPNKGFFLEQWTSEKDSVLACEVTMVTLSLTKNQRDIIMKATTESALSLFTPLIRVTGKIRWSESSLEVAGNGVLVNITDVSIY